MPPAPPIISRWIRLLLYVVFLGLAGMSWITTVDGQNPPGRGDRPQSSQPGRGPQSGQGQAGQGRQGRGAQPGSPGRPSPPARPQPGRPDAPSKNGPDVRVRQDRGRPVLPRDRPSGHRPGHGQAINSVHRIGTG